MIKFFSALVLIFCLFIGVLSGYCQKKYVVVLDAGHGGKDPGNLGNKYKEKNIALKVALDVGKELEKNDDIVVVYTRKTDVFVELHRRAKIANRKKADLFVSIHCDSHTSNVHGAGTFVLGVYENKRNLEIAKRENSVILLEKDYKKNYDYNPNSPESMIGLSLLQEENLDKSLSIADLVQKNFVKKANRYNRGVKQAGFLVLRNTVMPSVLIELGFLTNKKEGRYLNSKKGQSQMAGAIAKAIRKYVNQLELNTIGTEVKGRKVIKKSTIFRVQIASGKAKLSTKPYNFKGLKNIERSKIGSFYKYYYGKTTDYKTIIKMLRQARKKYRSAFIVAFKDRKKVSVSKALDGN